MAEVIEDGKVLAHIEAVDGQLVVLGPNGERVMCEGDNPEDALVALLPETPGPDEQSLLADSDDLHLPLPELKPGEPPMDGTMIRRGHLRFERLKSTWIMHLPEEVPPRTDWPDIVESIREDREERTDMIMGRYR